MPFDATQAEILLSATHQNRDLRIVEKARQGKPLTHAERTYLESLRAGVPETGTEYVTRLTDLAAALGVTRQRLNYHRHQPSFPKPDNGRRWLRAELLAYARKAGLPPPSAPGQVAAFQDRDAARDAQAREDADFPDLHRERALLTRAQRVREEMDNARAAATLLDAPAVEAAWDLIRANVRQRALALPAKLESQCNLPPGPRAALRKLIDAEIDDLLTDLSQPPDYQLDTTPEDTNANQH